MFAGMKARRLLFVLTVGLGVGLAGLTASVAVVAAQPKPPAKKPPAKKPPPKKGPLAPAKDSGAPAKNSGTPAATDAPAATGSGKAPAATSAPAGSAAAAGSEGKTVQMAEDPPPSDMTGTAENPDTPKTVIDPDAQAVVTVAPPPVRTGYPIEEAARPITLPRNMSEVSLAPHAQVSPYAASTALRARYGITPKIQLGLTYLVGGIFDDPSTLQSKQGFHPGKALGLDVTYMVQDWVGVKVGVPIYISPLAVSLAIGAPIKFMFGDKLALGGLDDLLNIRLDRFAPTFYQELQNATNANDTMTNTIKSQGELRVSLFGVYQYRPNVAIIARTGIQMEDFATGKTDGCVSECLTTFIHAGFNYSPRRYLDLGLQIGFDDLAHGGSFAPAGFLAFRI
jgi:hypothetical protein